MNNRLTWIVAVVLLFTASGADSAESSRAFDEVPGATQSYQPWWQRPGGIGAALMERRQ